MPQQAFNEFYKHFSQSAQPVDVSAIAAVKRRDFEAVSAAGQMLSESAQAIAKHFFTSLQNNMQYALTTSRDFLTTQSPELNISRQAEFARTSMDNALSSLREISETATKSGFEAAQLLQKRVSDSISELHDATSRRAS